MYTFKCKDYLSPGHRFFQLKVAWKNDFAKFGDFLFASNS